MPGAFVADHALVRVIALVRARHQRLACLRVGDGQVRRDRTAELEGAEVGRELEPERRYRAGHQEIGALADAVTVGGELGGDRVADDRGYRPLRHDVGGLAAEAVLLVPDARGIRPLVSKIGDADGHRWNGRQRPAARVTLLEPDVQGRLGESAASQNQHTQHDQHAAEHRLHFGVSFG